MEHATSELSAQISDHEPERTATPSPWGFGAGLIVGALLTFAAIGVGTPSIEASTAIEATRGLPEWIALNLGHSFWLFALVLALYLMNLQQLSRLLSTDPQSRRVVSLTNCQMSGCICLWVLV